MKNVGKTLKYTFRRDHDWGGKVILAENVAKGYGDRLLYENLNFALPPGGIVGIIGPNGAGKKQRCSA